VIARSLCILADTSPQTNALTSRPASPVPPANVLSDDQTGQDAGVEDSALDGDNNAQDDQQSAVNVDDEFLALLDESILTVE